MRLLERNHSKALEHCAERALPFQVPNPNSETDARLVSRNQSLKAPLCPRRGGGSARGGRGQGGGDAGLQVLAGHVRCGEVGRLPLDQCRFRKPGRDPDERLPVGADDARRLVGVQLNIRVGLGHRASGKFGGQLTPHLAQVLVRRDVEGARLPRGGLCLKATEFAISHPHS
eukprot:7617424-Pyramimonas_sp.AAC.1